MVRHCNVRIGNGNHLPAAVRQVTNQQHVYDASISQNDIGVVKQQQEMEYINEKGNQRCDKRLVLLDCHATFSSRQQMRRTHLMPAI